MRYGKTTVAALLAVVAVLLAVNLLLPDAEAQQERSHGRTGLVTFPDPPLTVEELVVSVGDVVDEDEPREDRENR